MSYPWTSLRSQAIDLSGELVFNGNSGVDGEVVLKEGGSQVWRKINEKMARYTDSTDGRQDVGGGLVAIEFDEEVFNQIDIRFERNAFSFRTGGYFHCIFQCLLSDPNAQSLITFKVNDKAYYGNFTTLVPSGSTVPFILECIIPIDAGSVLTITGEKSIGGPNYLLANNVYNIPITQLTIIKL
jgi:hypothetical protein